MSEDKLNIKNEMAQFDRKNRAFFDELSEDEKKKFAPFLMIRWGATVDASPEFQEWYLRATNERLNKHYFDISGANHKKLQWLLATTVSPGMGAKYHPWLAAKKKTTDNKAIKFLRNLYPHLKEDDLKLLSKINDTKELKAHARDMGWEDRDIKKEL